MRSLNYYWRALRLFHVAGICAATYAVAIFLDPTQPLVPSPTLTAAIIAIGFSVLGASFFHYGIMYRVYACKRVDRIIVQAPVVSVGIGLLFFGVSIDLGLRYVPQPGPFILLANAVIIMFYGWLLSRRWLTKNVSIAAVVTSPALLAASVVGHMSFTLLAIVFVLFFCHVAREIRKDITDEPADRGVRRTLPMVVGRKQASRIAAVLFMLSIPWHIALFPRMSNYLAAVLLALTCVVLMMIARSLWLQRGGMHIKHKIVLANWLLMIAMIASRVHLQ